MLDNRPYRAAGVKRNAPGLKSRKKTKVYPEAGRYATEVDFNEALAKGKGMLGFTGSFATKVCSKTGQYATQENTDRALRKRGEGLSKHPRGRP